MTTKNANTEQLTRAKIALIALWCVFFLWALASSIANKVAVIFYDRDVTEALPWTVRGLLHSVHPALPFVFIFIAGVILLAWWKNTSKPTVSDL
jgi:hypothetical protein